MRIISNLRRTNHLQFDKRFLPIFPVWKTVLTTNSPENHLLLPLLGAGLVRGEVPEQAGEVGHGRAGLSGQPRLECNPVYMSLVVVISSSLSRPSMPDVVVTYTKSEDLYSRNYEMVNS
jgi:hypothetical protein